MRKRRRGEWVIRTPSGHFLHVGQHRTAPAAAASFARERWPAKWTDLHQQGYRLAFLAKKGTRAKPVEVAYV